MKTFLETTLGRFFIFKHKCKLDNKIHSFFINWWYREKEREEKT
jgi:hypothetical protein